MELINPIPDSIKATEILYFDQAEVQKVKGNCAAFASAGTLHILYAKDYSRFVLQLNNWVYPLLRRLTISSVTGKDDATSRTYILPALNGYSFTLRITAPNSIQALSNLDTLLQNSCRFSSKGQEILRKVEASPDDKLVRQPKKNTGAKEVISETFKHVIKKVENKAATLKTGTKYLSSTKKRTNLKDLKNKNFRQEATSRIKKDFFKTEEKLSCEFRQRRKDNLNLVQLKEFNDLLNTSDKKAPTLYIPREELEEAILNNKDITTFVPIHQQSLLGETRAGMMSRDRNMGGQQIQAEKMPISGGLAHDMA